MAAVRRADPRGAVAARSGGGSRAPMAAPPRPGAPPPGPRGSMPSTHPAQQRGTAPMPGRGSTDAATNAPQQGRQHSSGPFCCWCANPVPDPSQLAEAVFTSCRHLFCARCSSMPATFNGNPRMCPLCKSACQARRVKQLPPAAQQLITTDPVEFLQKMTKYQSWQRMCHDATYQAQRRQMQARQREKQALRKKLEAIKAEKRRVEMDCQEMEKWIALDDARNRAAAAAPPPPPRRARLTERNLAQLPQDADADVAPVRGTGGSTRAPPGSVPRRNTGRHAKEFRISSPGAKQGQKFDGRQASAEYEAGMGPTFADTASTFHMRPQTGQTMQGGGGWGAGGGY